MPPCLDVYVWLPRCDAGALNDFIEHYVDCPNPGDDRLSAFMRAYITGTADADDRAAIAELRRDDLSGDAFSLYIRARDHYQAIITITREGAAVLGLSIDDPEGSPDVEAQGRTLLDQLRAEFASPAGCAGVELAPAQSQQEWEDDGLVLFRIGDLPREPL
jgi:hypothetical protein